MSETQPRSYGSWRLCIAGGWIFLVGYPLTWGILGGNFPPLPESISSADLYTHYVQNSSRIALGMGLSLVFVPFYFLFSAVVSRLMQKVEGLDGPLSLIEQMGGLTTMLAGQVAAVAWLVPAFRVQERTPELVRAFSDFGWLFFNMTFMVTTLQMFAFAIVFLSDKRAEKLIPAWVSWLSVVVGLIFIPLIALPFCLTGPFAWDGVFNYWISLSAFFVWVIVTSVYVSKAINRLDREGA